MSEFIAGFAPILVMWALPLTPMLCAAVAAVLEMVVTPVRRAGSDPVVVREATT